jgi:integral membrane protein
MTDSNETLTQRFLTIGKIEGYSYLALLFIAMPLKYMAEMPLAVRIAGSIHGFLFVAFVVLIILMLQKKRLSMENAIYAFLLSLVPFGTFFLKKVL